jgi:hypothetical protein
MFISLHAALVFTGSHLKNTPSLNSHSANANAAIALLITFKQVINT